MPKSKKKNKINFFLLPVFLILAIQPIIMRMYYGKTEMFMYDLPNITMKVTDTSLQFKVFFFIIMTIVMLVLGVLQVIKMDSSFRINLLKRFSPLFVYLFFVLLSTLFSINKRASLLGEHNTREPFFVLLGYALLVTYTFITIRNDFDVNCTIGAGLIGAFLVSVYGAIEAYAPHLLDNAFFRWLVVPSALRDRVSDSPLSNSGDLVSSTLYNPNYCGTFVCLFLPFALAMIIGKTQIWHKCVGALLSALLVLLLLKSGSSTGFVISIIVFFIICAITIKKWIPKWYLILPFVVAFIVAVFFYDRLQNFAYSKKLLNPVPENTVEYKLKGIDTTKSFIQIFYEDYDIHFTFKQSQYTGPYDFSCTLFGKVLPTETYPDGSTHVILPDDSNIVFWPFYIEANGEYGYAIENEIGACFRFTRAGDNYVFINEIGVPYESFVYTKLFAEKEQFASWRGLLWREAFSFLPEHIFLGAGPDCYPFVIRQNGMDIVAQHRFRSEPLMTARPHNYYLQMSINTGLTSLIAAMVFFIWYLVDSVKIYFSNKKTGWSIAVGLACLAAVLGFLGCGIANDSLITVSPQFWAILGLGMAINRQNVQASTENSNSKN